MKKETKKIVYSYAFKLENGEIHTIEMSLETLIAMLKEVRDDITWAHMDSVLNPKHWRW